MKIRNRFYKISYKMKGLYTLTFKSEYFKDDNKIGKRRRKYSTKYITFFENLYNLLEYQEFCKKLYNFRGCNRKFRFNKEIDYVEYNYYIGYNVIISNFNWVLRSMIDQKDIRGIRYILRYVRTQQLFLKISDVYDHALCLKNFEVIMILLKLKGDLRIPDNQRDIWKKYCNDWTFFRRAKKFR